MKSKRFRDWLHLAGAVTVLLSLGSPCTSDPIELHPESIKYSTEQRNDLTPEWSSDGRTVVGYADYSLYGADADGGDLWRITRGGEQFQSALSARNQLAYLDYSRSWKYWLGTVPRHSIKFASIDGQRTRTRHTVPIDGNYYRHLRSPVWSPDGSLLAVTQGLFTSIFSSSGAELYRISPPLIHEWSETESGWGQTPAVWSNDGKHIAVATTSGYQEGQGTIFTVRADGTDPRTIVNMVGGVAEISTPAWSPDNARIYFAIRKEAEEHAVLYSINRDGTELEALATLRGHYYLEVKTSPTGKELLLISRASTYSSAHPPSGLNVVKADGSDLRHLREGYLYASWAPDGNRIAVLDLSSVRQENLLYTISPDGAARQVLIRRNEDGKVVGGHGERP